MKIVNPSWKYEHKHWLSGKNVICGVDEVGRGALAGPVVVVAVVFKSEVEIVLPIRDSKTLSRRQREKLAPEIKKMALAYSYGLQSAEQVDNLGIVKATHLAAVRAIESLNLPIDFVLMDGKQKITGYDDDKQEAIVRGDQQSYSIAAASILAKVYRDQLMFDFQKKYPEYGFETHVGYGTKRHIEAIKRYGLCPLHRRSFVKNILA